MNTNLSEETKKRLHDVFKAMHELLPVVGEACGLDRWITEETQEIQHTVARLETLPYTAAIAAASELKRIASHGVHTKLREKLTDMLDLVLQVIQMIRSNDRLAVLDCSGPGTVVCVPAGKELRASIEAIVDRDKAERQLREQRETASYSASKSTIAPAADASGCQVSLPTDKVSPSFIARLLEQGNSFDLGDGWSVARSSDKKWHVYFQAKHWWSWLRERDNRPIPDDGKWSGYESVLDAVEVWESAAGDRQTVEQFAKSKRP